MKLSVIICTYNRDKYIYNVLKSIAENDFSQDLYEIVLVNNNSSDNTELECTRFQVDYPNVSFRYCVEKNQGLSYARNRGILESNNEILIYVDDDATVNKEYLSAYFTFFANNPSSLAAGGPVEPVYETAEPKWMSHYTLRLITGYVNKGNKMLEYTDGSYPGGGNCAFRKEVFAKIGHFNVDLGRKGNSLVGAEEKDVFDKIQSVGGRYFYLPIPVLFHIIPESKLTADYFNRITYAIGVSERKRTLAISNWKYIKRFVAEGIKWAASIILFIGYTFAFQSAKGAKLISFRWNVTKGLFGK